VPISLWLVRQLAVAISTVPPLVSMLYLLFVRGTCNLTGDGLGVLAVSGSFENRLPGSTTCTYVEQNVQPSSTLQGSRGQPSQP
jgi:hypothetical protein